MSDLFEVGVADLTRISGGKPNGLSVSKVVHQAFIKVSFYIISDRFLYLKGTGDEWKKC